MQLTPIALSRWESVIFLVDRVIHFFEQLGLGSYNHSTLEISELANRVDKHVLYNIFTQERRWKQNIFPGDGPRILAVIFW